MKVKIKKLYKGLADVRSYDVQKAIETNEPIIIEHEGEFMKLTPDQLKDEVKHISKEFPSKIGGTPYKLHSYEWDPNM